MLYLLASPAPWPFTSFAVVPSLPCCDRSLQTQGRGGGQCTSRRLVDQLFQSLRQLAFYYRGQCWKSKINFKKIGSKLCIFLEALKKNSFSALRRCLHCLAYAFPTSLYLNQQNSTFSLTLASIFSHLLPCQKDSCDKDIGSSDDSGSSPHLLIFHLITSAESLLPWKVAYSQIAVFRNWTSLAGRQG